MNKPDGTVVISTPAQVAWADLHQLYLNHAPDFSLSGTTFSIAETYDNENEGTWLASYATDTANAFYASPLETCNSGMNGPFSVWADAINWSPGLWPSGTHYWMPSTIHQPYPRYTCAVSNGSCSCPNPLNL